MAKSKRRQPKSEESGGAGAEALVAAARVAPGNKAEADRVWWLASKYGLGHGVEVDEEKSMRYCLKAAQLGVKDAQYNIGISCRQNNEPVEAARWFLVASNQGHAGAQNNLGLAYWKGNGVPQDLEEAARLFRLAADAGDVNAQYNLGVCLKKGDGMEQDSAAAARWFEKASAQGDARALNELGRLYFYGDGVQQHCGAARHLLELAAEKGNAVALLNLGEMYENGIGVEKDVARAKQYYRRAGEQDEELASGKTAEERMNEYLDEIKHTCASCKTVGDGLKVCTRCKGPRYCGLACQKDDWPVHKRVCQRPVPSANDAMSADANDA